MTKQQAHHEGAEPVLRAGSMIISKNRKIRIWRAWRLQRGLKDGVGRGRNIRIWWMGMKKGFGGRGRGRSEFEYVVLSVWRGRKGGERMVLMVLWYGPWGLGWEEVGTGEGDKSVGKNRMNFKRYGIQRNQHPEKHGRALHLSSMCSIPSPDTKNPPFPPSHLFLIFFLQEIAS